MFSREFQIFAKPAGSLCNLNCSYCYYSGNSISGELTRSQIMSNDLLEIYIRQHIEATTGELIMFSWHGGEPLLRGIDFFRKVAAIQKKYIPPGKSLINGVQTNGTLLNDEWCSFFSEENFLVGISIDGPEIFHNRFRITNNATGTFSNVINGYRLLQKHKITTEILCVVNSVNSLFPSEVYSFFKSLDARFISFLPLVEPKKDLFACVTTRSVSADDFGRFLITIFDEWKDNDIGKIKIQIFEEALQTAFDNEHTLCVFKKNCGGVPVIEWNGDFYICDHFVNIENLLGNILEKPVSYFLDSEKQLTFGMAKSKTLPEYCLKCEVLTMCNGECPKNRFLKTPDGENGLNYLCAGYKMFFKHCLPLIKAVRKVNGN